MVAIAGENAAQTRLRWATACAALALWALPALILAVPNGLLPFGVLLLASSLLVPLRLAHGVREIGWPWWLALAGVLAPLLLVAGSIRMSGSGHGLDGPDRWLALPWIMAWAWVLQPPRDRLWQGALVGLAAAAALALAQIFVGQSRPGGWLHPIVFANIVLVLMVLAVFCRPPRSWAWVGLGLGLGTLAIILSGTRGVWPGLGLLLLVLAMGGSWRSRRRRLLLVAALLAGGIVLLVTVPALTEHTRLAELRQDIERIERGDHNSSAGARLERLRIAARAVADAPWTGTGYGEFDRAMQYLPACRSEAARTVERCHYGHAHNDLAEWAATMGMPGALALALLYGIPLWLFLRLRRLGDQGSLRGSASAGAMLVAVFMLGGLTQSMFAHQASTAVYAAMCGLLLGLGLREARWPPRTQARGVSTKV